MNTEELKRLERWHESAYMANYQGDYSQTPAWILQGLAALQNERRLAKRKCRLEECRNNAAAEIKAEGYCALHWENLNSWKKCA